MGGDIERIGDWLNDEFGAIVISPFDDAVNEGRAYGSGFIFTGTAVNAQQNFLINGKAAQTECHAQWIMSAGGDSAFFIYEDPTVLLTGTSVPAVQFNRHLGQNTPGDPSPQWRVSRGAGLGAIGTPIRQRFIPGGSGVNSQGSFIEFPFKFVFAPGHVYFITLINFDSVAATIGVLFDWYEVAP